MATLTLKNTCKNLTLVAAGALIAVPLGGIASAADDDLPYIASIEVPTYTIKGSNRLNATFELVETDGEILPALVEEESRYLPLGPDDDE